MRKLKILVYGDLNINFIDGSGIWLTSILNMLSIDRFVEIDILLKAKVKDSTLINSVYKRKNINFIHPFDDFDLEFENKYALTINDASNVIELLDEKNDYDCILLRGAQLVTEMIKSKLSPKLLVYITDFHNITSKKEIQYIYDQVGTFFVQTNELKEYVMEMHKKIKKIIINK